MELFSSQLFCTPFNMHTWIHRNQRVSLTKQDELAQKKPRTETKHVGVGQVIAMVGIMGGQEVADRRRVGGKAGSTGQEK